MTVQYYQTFHGLEGDNIEPLIMETTHRAACPVVRGKAAFMWNLQGEIGVFIVVYGLPAEILCARYSISVVDLCHSWNGTEPQVPGEKLVPSSQIWFSFMWKKCNSTFGHGAQRNGLLHKGLDKSTNPVPDHALIHLKNRHTASDDDVALSFDIEIVMEAGGTPYEQQKVVSWSIYLNKLI
ncbi:hypothetical protein Cgig2_008428 [Carnegiea gigantea]|uniref:Uncharacterized protein n=1 Tax=Carnegiea gigantea TaxID=171969 RepID=A0A9Q1Q6R5_9CARY|nr:hypothetical protein Cgig2_008428 [Carnegiea gigantea]